MFRKPREDISQTTSLSNIPLIPSVGRPPTPPDRQTRSSMASRTTTFSQTPPKNSVSTPLPRLGPSQTRTGSTSKGGPNASAFKSKSKGNTSILSFFKKEDSSGGKGGSSPGTIVKREEEGGLFFQENEKKNRNSVTKQDGAISPSSSSQIPTPPREQPWSAAVPDDSSEKRFGDAWDEDSWRYNETDTPVKRRKLVRDPETPEVGEVQRDTNDVTIKTEGGQEADLSGSLSNTPISNEDMPLTAPGRRSSGPFADDAGDDDDAELHRLASSMFQAPPEPQPTSNLQQVDDPRAGMIIDESEHVQLEHESQPDATPIPTLKRETTSIVGGDGFEGFEDFIDDEFPEDGEEYMERRWMDEQHRMEMEIEGGEDEYDDEEPPVSIDAEPTGTTTEADTDANAECPACPICSSKLQGISDDEASRHVNACLDGNPLPLPKPSTPPPTNEMVKIKLEPATAPQRRFQRSAIARPGQDNPINLNHPQGLTGLSSAFSKIMSSHAEDAAWATAAASEMASRGKPAHQRTCPFYKILPGFFICVDAFRYGAVQGCQAYFLSHFHSDHYIGLTSSWCHGPIYCSHVTANLVRQQLRVDPKWVVDLEFDDKIEVPGTQGVHVTMIPANHCPGSSLYLYEKVIGKGKTPKVQRVLHCGDFRACPAHVQHPLLRPDVVDAVTGKLAQQKLDVCYLDTTYLTPKYAFPTQEEVIKACADMCVSLSKKIVDENDDWEQTKKERAGSGMVNFIRKDSDTLVKTEAKTEVKPEIKEEDDIDAMKVAKPGSSKKSRGRLLVICGTYSIGKERICLGIARALNSKIYAPPHKQKICAALEDPELSARLTNDPYDAQVHMQMLMEIRAKTLADYLSSYKPRFSRIVGFRPSGWNYRPPQSRFTESPLVTTVLHSENWKSRYSMAELVPQRGSTREASCFGVPYSEHSSFRELTMFCCALRIDKIIPTVNIGSAKSREKMKAWCEKWAVEKKKNGLFKVKDGQAAW
ncbi:hypothetical protein MMC25_006511 [Agyrium rufum]|nr:hypothetical protein [Agyrium rufum]